jgi:hypothetical protein
MVLSVETPRDHGSVVPGDVRAVTRRSAIVLWGAAGAVILAVIVQGLVRWLISGERRPTPAGPDHYDHLVILRAVEIVSGLFLLGMLYLLVVHPLLVRRRFEFDGMLLIGCVLVHFIDPVFNYFSPTFLQNSHSVQWGSWANFIPGYASPSGDAGFVEGVLWAAALYGLFGVCAAMAGCWILQRIRAWRPGITNVASYAMLFGIFAVIDFVLENFFVRSEIYIFWGSWSDLTLWSGELYQFPVYETALACIYALGFVWLRDTRDARGLSVVEQGALELRVSARLRPAARFCAITAFSLVWGVVSYFGPFNYLAMKSDTYPELPSYLQGGAFCGTAGSDPCPAQYLRELNHHYRQTHTTR